MAADEYFDAIGKTISYVLSGEDFIARQVRDSSGIQFVILRDGIALDLYAQPNNRYFTLVYYFNLTGKISDFYREDGELFQKHLDQYDVDDAQFSDENLYENVATLRIADIDEEDAHRVINKIRGTAMHTDCRFNSLKRKHPEDQETEVWNGIAVSGLLYPFESDYSPRDYEQTVQEVISVGKEIDQRMKKLGVMKEIDFQP